MKWCCVDVAKNKHIRSGSYFSTGTVLCVIIAASVRTVCAKLILSVKGLTKPLRVDAICFRALLVSCWHLHGSDMLPFEVLQTLFHDLHELAALSLFLGLDSTLLTVSSYHAKRLSHDLATWSEHAVAKRDKGEVSCGTVRANVLLYRYVRLRSLQLVLIFKTSTAALRSPKAP